MLGNFLRHREAEQRQELGRLEALVESAAGEGVGQEGRAEGSPPRDEQGRPRKRPRGGSEGPSAAEPAPPRKAALRRYLKRVERLFARLILLSACVEPDSHQDDVGTKVDHVTIILYFRTQVLFFLGEAPKFVLSIQRVGDLPTTIIL